MVNDNNNNSDASAQNAFLIDDFQYFNTTITVKLKLFLDSIKFYKIIKSNEQIQTLDKSISVADIAGCSIGKGHKNNDKKSYLTIYTYPKSEQNAKRKRTVIELEFVKFETFEQNLEHIQQWSAKIHHVLELNHSIPKEIASRNSFTNKPFLVYINPNAGAGKAKNLFQERIMPVWAEANISYTLVITQYPNFAREQMHTIDINNYKGILIVSGDGLLYEVINGLMERDDWQEAIKIPVGQLPGGSGNAFASSICYLAKEAYSNLNLESFAMHMGYLTCKYDICPMDLVSIDISQTDEVYSKLKYPKRIYSFLSTEWAIIADVDIESEKYRYLGGFRFVVGALKRIMNLRVYRGRISFLPVDNCKDYKPKNSQIKLWSKDQKEKLKNEINAKKKNTDIDELSKNNLNNLKSKYCNPLDKPVPDDWLIIEENFVFVLIAHLPLIAKDFNASPNAKLDSGDMLLIYIKEGISKVQLLQLFNETESGNYINNPFVESVRIKAFRLEPHGDKGNIMIDGEKIPYGPIQGEILPSIANAIAKKQ